MSAGREFHVCGAATENARRVSSVRTRGTVSSGATDDRRGRAGAAGWIRSIRYAGVEVDMKHHRLTKENKWTEKINGMTDNPRLT